MSDLLDHIGGMLAPAPPNPHSVPFLGATPPARLIGAATEELHGSVFGPGALGVPAAERERPLCQILRKGDAYHLLFETYAAFDYCGYPQFSAPLAVWLHGLADGDTVHVYLTNSEPRGNDVFTIDGFLTVINALFMTPAHLGFVLDSCIGGIGGYLALACGTLLVTKTGHLTLTPVVALQSGARWATVLTGFADELYQRARDRGILTAAEYQQLADGVSVRLTAKQLLERTGSTGVQAYVTD